MKNTKEIKNVNFHQQLGGEKIREAVAILLLQFNDNIIYDIACCFDNKQIKERIKEININNVTGLSYVAVTTNFKFVEYKKIILKK